MLKILGAGMPRTGTRTLCEALKILGYNAVHHDRKSAVLFPDEFNNAYPVFMEADIDAIIDCPTALYWREIVNHAKCKVILTVREAPNWWESIKWHTNQIRTSEDMRHIRYTDALHGLLFGVAQPNRYWWQRRFGEHNAMVVNEIPAKYLLVMNITAGDKWEKLCPFLGVEEPNVDWPWENKRRES